MLANDFVKAGSKGEKWTPSVTAKQARAVESVLRPVSDDQLRLLANYTESGDLADLGEMYPTVKKWVDQAKALMPNESQAKRIWPRKVAAIAVAHLS